MKEIYPYRKIFFLEWLLPLCLATFIPFLILVIYEEYLGAIIAASAFCGLFILFCLLPIKLWFTKIHFDEKGICHMFGKKIVKQILWDEMQAIYFIRGHGKNTKKCFVRFSKTIRSIDELNDWLLMRSLITLPINNNSSLILSEYLSKATKTKLFGIEILTPDQIEKLKMTKTKQ